MERTVSATLFWLALNYLRKESCQTLVASRRAGTHLQSIERLRYFAGMSAKEAAEVLGVNVAALKSRLLCPSLKAISALSAFASSMPTSAACAANALSSTAIRILLKLI